MKASRVPLIGVLLIGVLWFPALARAQQRPAIADQIAKTYGFDSWGQVEAIRYTFHLDAGKLQLHRSWVWEPKTDQITYDGPDKDGKPVKITYRRSELANQSAFVKEMVDPGFFNDQYWLLFPFHLIWDTGATIQDAGMQKLPLGKGSARKVVVQYPSSGGYHPGDAWALFVGPDQPNTRARLQVRGISEAGWVPCDLGGLQEGWSGARLDRAPRKGRRQPVQGTPLERGRQAGGIRQVDGGEVGALFATAI